MFIHYQQLVSRRGLVDKIPVRMSEVPGSIPVTSHILKIFTTFFVRYENFLLPISSLIMLPFASFKKEMYCTPVKKKNYQHPSIDIPHLALHFFILLLYHRPAVLQNYLFFFKSISTQYWPPTCPTRKKRPVWAPIAHPHTHTIIILF